MWHKYLLRNYKQTSNVSIGNGNIKYPIGSWTVYSISSMFPLLLLTLEVKNTICNSLINICTMSWCNLNKIWWSKLHKIWSILTKSCFACQPFWHIVGAILKEVSVSETIQCCWTMNQKTSIYFIYIYTIRILGLAQPNIAKAIN